MALSENIRTKAAYSSQLTKRQAKSILNFKTNRPSVMATPMRNNILSTNIKSEKSVNVPKLPKLDIDFSFNTIKDV